MTNDLFHIFSRYKQVVNIGLDKLTNSHDLNTELVSYSDPHCNSFDLNLMYFNVSKIFTKIFFLKMNPGLNGIAELNNCGYAIVPNQVVPTNASRKLKFIEMSRLNCLLLFKICEI